SSQPRGDAGQKSKLPPRSPQRPQAVVRVAKPPTLKQKPPKEEKKQEAVQKPLMKLTPDMLKPGVKAEDILTKAQLPEAPVAPAEIEDEEGEDRKGGSKVRPGQVTGRDKRHQQRNERAKQRKDRQDTPETRSTRVLLADEDDRPQRLKQRIQKIKKQ